MTIAGCATLQGTTRYRERFKDISARNHFRLEQDRWLSSIGAGTYLGNADDDTDQRYVESIARVVQRGERAVGKALHVLTGESGFAREEIVICTKGGYLPFDGAPPRDVRRYVEETFVKPGIASLEDFVGGSHCMTPAYLQNQLDQSLRNMDLAA